MQAGIIFNIQKLSIHDGPGIRTTVFLKGCPLKCLWCANPESQGKEPEVACFPLRCTGCGYCRDICPSGAIGRDLSIDREVCTQCLKCGEECYAEGKKTIGRSYTAKEVIEEVIKDREFYEKSGGGVTFSGGEPLMQWDFFMECLRLCKEAGIHRAVETTGMTSEEKLLKAASFLDLVYFDLKHMDEKKHNLLTGVSNSQILKNFRKLTSIHRNVTARIPVIPGCNDEEENIRQTAAFAAECGAAGLELLPYHRLGVGKYTSLGREYCLTDREEPEKDHMKKLLEISREACGKHEMKCTLMEGSWQEEENR